ncbi:bifunctional glutathionylspermidine amidase/synthase [Brumicola blandensis]|uniref:Bifunctional glutathionylspermidine amidase/synthase n=1 Tax=Brumicola blandensis TaxID=3075611 RepID=A0AAW8QZG6_9ALTE|nr:bifunctional glutathionylspermidine amidase/synthase [Alteromonas sp. W409]MDT0581534.1 bifunctional glutathionylspermidine amidase/synthase [Alteromonas sp. W409]
MSKSGNQQSLPFGAPLGVASGGVISYSSDYKTVNEDTYPDRSAFRSYYEGVYMGYKWQCVEYARRWLYVNKGLIFNDVSMAYEIFRLSSIRDIKNNTELPLCSFANGSQQPPRVGDLLIWEEGGEFEETGHVAIVSEVFDDKIHIVEQNMSFEAWPDGRNYSREIKAKIGKKGDFWLQCSFDDSVILGWVSQTEDRTHAVEFEELPRGLSNIKIQTVNAPASKLNGAWLNIANEDESAYVDMMDGHLLSSSVDDFYQYFAISETAEKALDSATDELHGLFMHATDYVLQHPDLLSKFSLPASILPKLRQSWDNRLNQLITSRFDFAMSERGLKVYEYNCDSASCYMEAGKVQGKWAKHLGVKQGMDNGEKLFKRLVRAWKKSDATGLVHVLQDNDKEEDYHALFMQSAIEAAGFECERIIGLNGLRWGPNNNIVDQHGNIIKWVWKTWAWETAIDQLRADEAANSQQLPLTHNMDKPVQLSDVLINDNIMIYEPMWTLIPSNKAILPVLWSLFPNHPLLLNTSFELTNELKESGYVVKPIVGRCGENIRLIDENSELIADKAGQFSEQEQVFQQLFALPKIGKYYVQVSTFTAAGHYAGSGVRVSESMIIGKESDCMALRTVDDISFQSLR